jgi:serine/threonine protein phosphatase PrpC
MLDLGIAERPKIGATISGDSYYVKENESTALIAVIDGLGGGEAAAEAAKKAYDAIDNLAERPLSMIMQAAHTACVGTRGAVVGLLRLDYAQHEASYVGVGNIGIHVVSRHVIKPLSRNGIVGYRMPTLMEHKAQYDAGDTFILFSDGISVRFSESPLMHETLAPQALADRVLETFGKDIDDATIVVVRTQRVTP